jgi:predicted DNA-binding transcriptional regulator AlpA
MSLCAASSRTLGSKDVEGRSGAQNVTLQQESLVPIAQAESATTPSPGLPTPAVTPSQHPYDWDEPLLTLKQVCKFTGLCAASVYTQIRLKQLPPPLKFGAASRWDPASVRAAVKAKLEQNAA